MGNRRLMGNRKHQYQLAFSKLPITFFPLPITLASGILMGLTTAPVSAWPLAWIALVPLWVLIIGGKLENSRLLFTALAWGIGYHGVALFWITGIHPMSWMGVPWLASLAIAIFCWSFITLWGAALVAIWAVCMSRLVRTTTALTRVLIGTALWCGLEYLWSLGPLWWTSLSFTQSPHNLAILHLGQISGPAAVTAAIVAVNGLLAESIINSHWLLDFLQSKSYPPQSPLIKGGSKKIGSLPLDNGGSKKIGSLPLDNGGSKKIGSLPFIRGGLGRGISQAFALCLILHIIGFVLYNQPLIQPTTTALKVGIIQGNIPNEIKLYPGGFRRAIEGYTTGYQTLAAQGVDAVLTPEGALPFLWTDVMNSSFYSAVREKGVVAWLGAFGEQGRSITNSLFTVTGKGEVFSRYNKVKLVPLGEYIPFEQFLGSFIDRLSPLDAHMVAGATTQLFDTPFGKAIAGICYESAYSEHFRYQAAAGGQFILTASNNAHYSKTMPAQHHAQDVMRSIETDRWAVRATNTGYSGIVDPHGRTLWISGINKYEIHAATIYRRQTQTLYVRWGDWLTPLLLIGSAIAWIISRRSISEK